MRVSHKKRLIFSKGFFEKFKNLQIKTNTLELIIELNLIEK